MKYREFKLKSKYQPTGDQPQALSQLVEGLKKGEHEQTLLGVTGSGKTFTMANIIQATQKPTLILAHNKTLAAQLYGEFKKFFPENEVHYFVSYFDYLQHFHQPTLKVHLVSRRNHQFYLLAKYFDFSKPNKLV